jgi:hypothetical protein
MQKLLSIIILLLASLITTGQNQKSESDVKNQAVPYMLPVPDGWKTERFPIPIGFAPGIPYSGVEDLRFAPGWAKAGSDEYWTYAFLWYLEVRQEFTAKIIKKNLELYYTGLIAVNLEKHKTTIEQNIPVNATIKKIKTNKGDSKTFSGTVHMLDYMNQKPVMLNCIIHVRNCPLQKKTCIFYELSPKEVTENVWESLNNLWEDFRITCEPL